MHLTNDPLPCSPVCSHRQAIPSFHRLDTHDNFSLRIRHDFHQSAAVPSVPSLQASYTHSIVLPENDTPSAKLREHGVKFVSGCVTSIADRSTSQLKEERRLQVLCDPQLGARGLIGKADPLVHPIRRHTVLIRAPKVD
ncbi:hypothetical protein FRC00_007514 [Tulasnella sp. 408]|nr:hypothetical protein FRC00_007514 [Tulasnella sp. 408]